MSEAEQSQDESGLRDSMTLLILARDSSLIRATTSFLNRRDISTIHVKTLSEAVDVLTRKEARIFLLSMNFPHPKVEFLPKVMQESFGVECIVFAEVADRATQKKISMCQAKHMILGSLSGPAVLMKVRSIERQAELKGQEGPSDTEKEMRASDRSGSSDIRVSGSQSRDEVRDSIFFRDSDKENHHSATLDSLLGMEIKNPGQESESLVTAADGIYVQKGRRSESGDVNDDRTLSPGLRNIQSRASNRPHSIKRTSKERRQGLLNAIQKGALIPHDNSKSRENRGREFQGLVHLPPKDSSAGILLPSAKSERSELLYSFESSVMRTTLQTLEKICGVPRPNEVPLDYKSAAIVGINVGDISACVILALGESQTPYILLKDAFREFESSLKVHGVNIQSDNMTFVVVDDLSIVQESFTCASFSAVSRSPDREFGIAYIEGANVIPKIVKQDDEMVMVPVTELKEEEPLSFDVFLHLPVNKKYLRYLKNGASLSIRQANKLRRHQISFLYVKEKDESEYRKFFLRQSLLPRIIKP